MSRSGKRRTATTCLTQRQLELWEDGVSTQSLGLCESLLVSVVPRRHKEAREKLDDLSEYIRATSVKLEKVVADDDLDALGVMMALFKTIRERESGPISAC